MTATRLMAPLPRGETTYEEIHRGCIAGIQDEIDAVRRDLARKGVDKPVDVEAGELEDIEGEQYIYRFRTKEKRVAPGEHDYVEVAVDGQRNGPARGFVVSVEKDGREVVVSVSDELPSTHRGALLFDPTFVLQAMLAAFEEELHPEESFWGRDNVMRTLGLAPALIHEAQVPLHRHEKRGLNADQLASVALSRGSELLLVFGPPGTGKTRVLGSTVRELAEGGYRVLVSAHTNNALDTAMESVIDSIPSAWIQDGEVVRVGKHSRDYEHLGISSRDVASRRAKSLDQSLIRRIEELERAINPFARPAASLWGKKKRRGKAKDALERIGHVLRTLAMARPSPKEQNAWEIVRSDARDVQSVVERHVGGAEAGARIVGATLSQIALDPERMGRFDAVVLDELSMAQLPQVVLAARMANQKLIGFGDPRQLPPVVVSNGNAAQNWLYRNLYSHLGLEDPAKEDPRRPMLTEQYRMDPKINQIVSETFYAGKLRCAQAVLDRNGPNDVVLVDTSLVETRSMRDGRSRVNPMEADLVVDIVKRLHEKHESDTGVVTPFKPQQKLIRSAIWNGIPGFFRSGGFVGTIHATQGGERNNVIVSLVDAGPPSAMSQFLDHRRTPELLQLINVALSRSRHRLIIVADASSFRRKYGDQKSLMMTILARAVKDGRYVRIEPGSHTDWIAEVVGDGPDLFAKTR